MSIQEIPITSNSTLKRVNALLKLHDDFEGLNQEMNKEIAEIEKKYLTKFTPLWNKRGEIVKGSVEPTDDESKPKEAFELPGLTDKAEKGIPKFWLTALMNHSQIGSLIEDVDAEPLAYLVDIKFEDTEKEIKAEFFFEENPFFSNTVLTKVITFDDEQDEIENIQNTPIQWKEGKNFTVKKVQKKTKGKGKAGKKPTVQVQTVEESVPCFFSTFLSPVDEEAEEEDDQPNELQFLQYQCLAVLKDIIVPNAVEWFLGRGVEDNEGMGDFEDFDDEGEEEDDDEDEEDEDDDEDEDDEDDEEDEEEDEEDEWIL